MAIIYFFFESGLVLAVISVLEITLDQLADFLGGLGFLHHSRVQNVEVRVLPHLLRRPNLKLVHRSQELDFVQEVALRQIDVFRLLLEVLHVLIQLLAQMQKLSS